MAGIRRYTQQRRRVIMAVESLTNGPPAKRLFVGLQIYGEPAIKLAAMSKAMSMQFTGAAGQRHLWEPDGTGHRHPPDCGGLDTIPYHITLRFLGPVDVGQVPALTAALAGVADTRPPARATPIRVRYSSRTAADWCAQDCLGRRGWPAPPAPPAQPFANGREQRNGRIGV